MISNLLRTKPLVFACLLLLPVGAPALWASETTLFLAREPLDERELRDIADADDLRAVPVLEAALGLRAARIAELAPAPIPLYLDGEAVVCLEGIARLAPRRAQELARSFADVPAAELRWKARAILARSGDPAWIHRAITMYFSEPDRWRNLLAEAADFDPRLVDYRRAGRDDDLAVLPLWKARVEYRLSAARLAGARRALLDWTRMQTSEPALALAARVLSRMPRVARDDDAVDRQLARLAVSQHLQVAVPALDGLARRSNGGYRLLFEQKLARGKPEEQAIAAFALERMGALDALSGLAALPSPLLGAEEPFLSAASAALTALGGVTEARRLLPILRGQGFRAVAPLLAALGPEDVFAVHELAQSLPADERDRALRLLAEHDHAALAGLPMSSKTIDVLHPYLARSSQPRVRARIQRAERARGAALASLLMSEAATREEKRSLALAMEDAWAAAVVAGGAAVAAELDQVWRARRDDYPGAWFSNREPSHDLSEALALIPGAAARQRLEQLQTVEAVEQLGRRSDAILSLPTLNRFSRSDSPELRLAAEKILLRLGAGGASAILQRRIALDQDLTALLASIARAPLPPRMVQDILSSAAASPEPSPVAMTALFLFHQAYPRHFVSWLPVSSDAFGRRVVSAIALSQAASRLPILVDVASSTNPAEIRSAAFAALVEMDLGTYARRLHRLAGEADRLVRFQTAAALVPTGEDWTMRLLLAELDDRVGWQRRWARDAFERLNSENSGQGLALLLRMIADDTATLFGLELFLDASTVDSVGSDRALQKQLWSRLSDDVAAGDALALELAARLTEPRALTTVASTLADR